MSKEFCDRCEHSIDFHRFLTSVKPTSCIAVFKDGKGEVYCKCNQFKLIENRE